MSGTPTFTGSTVRSPTQTNHFVPYSPTNKSRPFFNHEQYQGPPRTPPQFTPSTLARSPHFGSHPTLPSPLPAVNGHGSHHSEAASHYQSNPASPPYQLQRTYSGQLIPAHNLPPFGGTPSSHPHPVSRQGSLVQSPTIENNAQPNTNIKGYTGQDAGVPISSSRSQEVRERLPRNSAVDTNSLLRSPSEPTTPCHLPASYPSLP